MRFRGSREQIVTGVLITDSKAKAPDHTLAAMELRRAPFLEKLRRFQGRFCALVCKAMSILALVFSGCEHANHGEIGQLEPGNLKHYSGDLKKAADPDNSGLIGFVIVFLLNHYQFNSPNTLQEHTT